MQGLTVNSFRGSEGKIIVPGLGAVVGTFSSWTLRRAENGGASPRWTLHAVLSYQNDALLQNKQLPKKFICVLSSKTIFEFCSYTDMQFGGLNLIVEGVSTCP